MVLPIRKRKLELDRPIVITTTVVTILAIYFTFIYIPYFIFQPNYKWEAKIREQNNVRYEKFYLNQDQSNPILHWRYN